MRRFFKIIPACLTLLSFYSFANQSLTDAYICHNCSFSEARNLAKTKYELPSCEFTDLNGGPATVDTPMVCNSTSTLIAILNPQDRTLWKFNVHASFPVQNFMEVTASTSAISADEYDAADIYFDFYDDVIEVTNGGFLALNPSTFDSYQVSSASTSTLGDMLMTSSASANTAACTVAKEYFGSQIRQENVETFLEQALSQRLDGKTPYSQNQTIDFTGVGFQVAKGSVGFNVNWDVKDHPIALSIGDATTKLVFDLDFKGDITLGQGYYQVNMYLDRNASKIDNRRVDNAFPNGTVNDIDTTTSDLPCLREIAEEAADKAPWGPHDGGGHPNLLEPAGGGGLPSFCLRTVRMRTCSTDKNGQTCTSTEYSYPTSCF